MDSGAGTWDAPSFASHCVTLDEFLHFSCLSLLIHKVERKTRVPPGVVMWVK